MKSLYALSILLVFSASARASVSILPSRVEAESFNKDHDVKARIFADPKASKGAAIVLQSGSSDEEWIKYDVLASQDGVYNLEFALASGQSDRSFQLEVDGTNVTGDVIVPNTGDVHRFSRVRAQGVLLKKGSHSMKIVYNRGGFAVDYIDITFIRPQNASVDLSNLEVPESSAVGETSGSSQRERAGSAN
jgi:hypothetical protein